MKKNKIFIQKRRRTLEYKYKDAQIHSSGILDNLPCNLIINFSTKFIRNIKNYFGSEGQS